MRTILNLGIAAITLLCVNTSFANETYESEVARFSISFPDIFTTDERREDDMSVISLTCTYGTMNFVVSTFIYDEVIPKDEYPLQIAEGIVITADAFNSKFKQKKCTVWEAGTDVFGLRNVIKGKVKDATGSKFSVYGNIYICMAYGIEYRILALSNSKKNFNAAVETKFINSFRLKN